MANLIGIGIGIGFLLNQTTSESPAPPVVVWILATGFWNDDGVWDDNAFWID